MKTLKLDDYNFKTAHFLKNLPQSDLQLLRSSMVYSKFKKGQTVFTEASYPSGMFFLKKGRVKKYKIDKEGHQQIFYICCTGELFGCPALLSNEAYTNSAAAIEESEIGFIPRQQFLKLMEDSDTFSRSLISSFSCQFNAMINIVTIYSHTSARERLALVLLILNEKYGHSGKSVILLSRTDMANMAGVAVETLVRMLTDFKDEGIVTTQQRQVTVLQPRQLAEIARLVLCGRPPSGFHP